ncbi:MAG: HPF/RaiA family ribosome-associated protein [Candidatus Eremiobacterota bacterium]
MQVPLQVTFHGVDRRADLEALIRDRAAELEKVHQSIVGCRVAVEKPHRHKRTGTAWRVRIDLTVPPRQELAVTSEHPDLFQVVHEAFDAAARRLRRLSDRMRGEQKAHPTLEANGHVARLFEDHGFLRSLEGHDVYFHRNSLLGTPFARLSVGIPVRYCEEPGEKGPQASSLHVVV